MTETRAAARPRRAIGFWALVIFVGMAVALHWRIAPLSPGGFLPQAHLGSYSLRDLYGFASQVGADPGAVALYTRLLAWVDPAFVLLFSLWVVLSFDNRTLGICLALVFALLDLTENGMLLYLLSAMRWEYFFVNFDDMPVPVLTDAPLFLSWITSAKLVMAASLVLIIAGQALRTRLQSRTKP
ncbi:hypothetical protein [Tropicibacter oceani]|uniref:Uncharacterized protein n=1 Tax=Tropicibacter oceani TaxID=3058420 RepID=A0ABY8QLD7_9RHOB|nr:hypothetical protein [Tropicibacter oceani]WGW05456.1 hypothetical protein QF118_07885 [Tropicibacter oceani]